MPTVRRDRPVMRIPGMHGPLITVPEAPPASEQDSLRDLRLPVPLESVPSAPIPEPEQEVESVRIEHVPESGDPGFELELMVTDFHAGVDSVSIALTEEIKFRPPLGMKFRMHRGREIYNVCYAGASFVFPRHRIRGICFVIVEP